METSKQKRERFCHLSALGRRETSEVAKRLIDVLRTQRNKFPGFACRIDQFIAQVETDSKRSRASDRERVLGLLRAWEFGLTIKELMDDTGFTHWDIRQITSDLIKRGLVVAHEEWRSGMHSKQRVKVYRVKNKSQAT